MDYIAEKYRYSPHNPRGHKFHRPNEAPVYKPTPEEFKNPLQYIQSIKPQAEKFGICKIIPPPEWQPPFAVDMDNFRFTPRVQKINELEARTRIKLNFLEQIHKFWTLQGTEFSLPMVDDRLVDLFSLYHLVELEGGYYTVEEECLWLDICTKMFFLPEFHKDLRAIYKEILFPFSALDRSKDNITIKEEPISDEEPPTQSPPTYGGYKLPEGVVIKKEEPDPVDEVVIKQEKPDSDDEVIIKKEKIDVVIKTEKPDEEDEISEQYQSSGAYVKRNRMCGSNSKKSALNDRKSYKKKSIPCNNDTDPLAKYICMVCNEGDGEECMLLCDGCDDSYHTYCLSPPLTEVPKGDWRCPVCVAKEIEKLEAFGFEQSPKQYTLLEFGAMADRFKYKFFKKPVHTVPIAKVENEYWNILADIENNITVEYGADIHSLDHGSGFPSKTSITETALRDPETPKYLESPWNLNNLPVLPGSILSYINVDISGMKVPWMYVGMCFSTFCWHNEDHWSYSINYLHWGEPKTWYGVPSCDADRFECVMRLAAPELFSDNPDLLQQLTTTLHPSVLRSEGVHVYRIDQEAGEFVVTFPRAYHAGFNQGFNFAEAVNFALPDWLPIGRKCITYYSDYRRNNVFCHDELLVSIASRAEDLNSALCLIAYNDFLEMVSVEAAYRREISQWGVYQSQRYMFEQVNDDHRQCEICKTTCYLSSIICKCKTAKRKRVCLRHCHALCECPPSQLIMRYRWTMSELGLFLRKLKVKAEILGLFCSGLAPENAQTTEAQSRFGDPSCKALFVNSSTTG